jgi:hypothetical protein
MTSQAASEAPGVTAELDVFGRLSVCLDGLTDAARRLAEARERDRIAWEECHTIPLAPLSSAAAGNLLDERWQPRTGWAWQVLLLTVTFGAGATSAIVYETADASGIVPNNAKHSFIPDAASMATWEPKGLLLLPGNQLSWSSSGGGITVSGAAVEVKLSRLPDYLL